MSETHLYTIELDKIDIDIGAAEMDINVVKKPSMLVLGTSMKRTATEYASADSHVVSLNNMHEDSLYERASRILRRRIVSGTSIWISEVINVLPTHVLVNVLRNIQDKMSAHQLEELSCCEGLRGRIMMQWLEDEWTRQCTVIRRQIRDCPTRIEGETIREYYWRLEEYQKRRLEAIGLKLRSTYKKDESSVRTSKLINPRSADAGRDPLLAIRCSSSLMKKAKLETISSAKGNSRPQQQARQTPYGKMIPPRKQ